jgi:hypothetical protein
MVYCFTTDGDSVTSFRTPNGRNGQGLAWDSQRDWLWMCDITTDIVAADREGNQQRELRRREMMIYGLAFWPDDPDGYQLYVFHNQNDTMAVSKLDIENDALMDVAYLNPEYGGSPKGAYITNQLDPYSWVFVDIADVLEENGGDRLEHWQLQAKTDWISLDPLEGVIEADGQQDLTVTLSTEDLLPTVYEVSLAFAHDGRGENDTIGVRLNMVPDTLGPEPPSAFSLLQPENEAEIVVYPEGGDSLVVFDWENSVDPNPEDTVNYIQWIALYDFDDSTLVDSAQFQLSESMNEIFIRQFLYDSLVVLNRDLGLAWRLCWWVQAISGEDIVECNERFTFWILEPSAVDDQLILPVRFGLQSVYPNPFNSRLRVEYGLEKPSDVELLLYDLAGREVTTLTNGSATAGMHRLVWDAGSLPSGVYMLRLHAGESVDMRKVVLVR